MLLRWLLEKPISLKSLVPVFGETLLDLLLLATSKHLILIILLPVMVLSPPFADHFKSINSSLKKSSVKWKNSLAFLNK